MDLLNLFKNYLFSQDNKPTKVTVKNYLSDINHFIRWYENTFTKSFAPKEISSLTLNDYRNSCSEVFSQSSLDRHFSSLRKFFKFLLIEGVISLDPFSIKKLNLEAEKDPWHIKDFKDFLYVYNSSRLTIKNYLIDIKQFLGWATQVTDSANVMAEIDSELVGEYKQRLLEQSFSPATINRKLSSLRKYLAWAQDKGLIEDAGLGIGNVAVQAEESQRDALIPSTTLIQSETKAQTQAPKTKSYSHFPPFRIAQKVSEAFIFTLDTSLIIHLAKLVDGIEHAVWKSKGQPVFTKIKAQKSKLKTLASNFQLLSPTPLSGRLASSIKNLPKEFYSPLEISTKYLPWYKKAWITARYARPKWYKTYHSYPIAHYLNFAVLIIFLMVIGFGFYNTFFQKQSPTLAVAGTPVAPPRILSFQGRLTDQFDTPISTPSALRFTIYDAQAPASSAADLLWQEEDQVSPDQDGIFNILLGNTLTACANALVPATGACQIPQALFATESALFLGVTVGNTPELTPRQQLATVAYATNAETLQGMVPTTSGPSAYTNTVLALDGTATSPTLTIGGAVGATFKATGGQFQILGTPLLLGTVAGSGGNVAIVPDALGFIDLRRPLINSIGANNINGLANAVEVDSMLGVLATSSGQSALTINQNGGGLLINASAGGISKFMVDSGGSATIAGHLVLSNPAAKTTFGGIAYAWPGTIPLNGSVLSAQTTGQLSWITPATSLNFWQRIAGALSPITSSDDLLLGSNATASADFAFTGMYSPTFQTQATFSGQFVVTPNHGYGGNASVSGNLTLGSYGLTGAIQTTANQLLTIGGATTGTITLSPNNAAAGSVINLNATNINSSLATVTELATPTTITYGGAATILNLGAPTGTASISGTLVLGGTNSSLIEPGNGPLYFNYKSGGNAWSTAMTIRDNTGYVGIGTTTPLNTLDIRGTSGTLAVASVSGQTSFAALVTNNNGVGDLFTASASGWTRFTIQNNGNIAATGTLTGLTGLTLASGPITVGASTGSSQCLIGGANASWGSCATGVVGNNYWNLTNGNGFPNQGYLTPINSTADLLIGGQSTASASFAVLGLATNSISGVGGHQTTASASGQFVVMPNNGYGGNASVSGNLTIGAFAASAIQSTNNQLLTIGGNTTGTITLAPNNAAAGSVINLNATNINSSLATVTELATPTTITYGGATTALTLGGASATITLNGTTIATNQVGGTLAMFNTGLTGTLNFAGLANVVSIGANQLQLGASASTSGNIKFQVVGSSTSTAAGQFWNAFPNTGNAQCTNGVCHTALSLRLGQNNLTSVPGSGDRFINFAAGSGMIIGSIRGNGSTTMAAAGVTLASTGGDYAEWFKKANVNDVLNPGDLACVNSSGGVIKCDNDNTQLLGVISDSYIVLGNDSHDGDPNYVVVGLLGQLKTEINSQNGAINPGDYLTYSNTSGIATKATTAGPVIGKAVEGGTSGEINVYINPTWYDPQVQLTSSGNLNIVDQTAGDTNYTVPHYYTLNDSLGNPLQRVGEFSDAAIANLRAGLVNAQQVTTNALSVATTNVTIGGQSLKDYIVSVVTSAISNSQFVLSNGQAVISPLASVDTLQTNLIVPLDNNSSVALKLDNNELSILNNNSSSGWTVATIDNQGNASFSGQLTATGGEFSQATVSGTLHIGKLIDDEIGGGLDVLTNQITALNNSLAVLSDSTGSAQFATSSAQLPTSLNLASLNVAGLATVSGDLNVGGSSLIQGALSVLNNITTQNLLVSQFAYFIQDVVFKGNVRFDSTPTFNSDTAGFAVVNKGYQSVNVAFTTEYVNTPIVTASIALDKMTDATAAAKLDSAILNGNISYIITNRSSKGFTIKLNQPASNDLSFSWVALSVQNAQTQSSISNQSSLANNPNTTQSAAFQSILNQLNSPTPTPGQ
jgi:site-specific recombinase XerD